MGLMPVERRLGEVGCILFDMSGTLVNDFYAVYSALLDVFNVYGLLPPTRSQFCREFKLPYSEYLLDKGFKTSQLKEAIGVWVERYSVYRDSIRLFDDVKTTLSQLEGIKLGVVSQTPEELVKRNLDEFDIISHFDVVEYDKYKPDPTGLISALKKIGMDESVKVIYIGDMREDMLAARRANLVKEPGQPIVIPVGIARENGGFHDIVTLQQGNPAFVIRDLTEVIPLVELLPENLALIDNPLQTIV